VKTATERGRRKNGHPNKTILADIVRRVVEAAQPDKIILFGSAARGEMGPNSDIDLLVIKAGRFNRWRLTTAIYRHLRGKGAPVDIVVVTPERGQALWRFALSGDSSGLSGDSSGIERGKGRVWGVNAIPRPILGNGSTGRGAISHSPRATPWARCSKTFVSRRSRPPRKLSKRCPSMSSSPTAVDASHGANGRSLW
jgi:predicted nucleotidyltransferase